MGNFHITEGQHKLLALHEDNCDEIIRKTLLNLQKDFENKGYKLFLVEDDIQEYEEVVHKIKRILETLIESGLTTFSYFLASIGIHENTIAEVIKHYPKKKVASKFSEIIIEIQFKKSLLHSD